MVERERALSGTTGRDERECESERRRAASRAPAASLFFVFEAHTQLHTHRHT
jgi:hypothetical protein